MGCGYGYDMMGWLGLPMMLLLAASIVGGIILVIVWAVRQSPGHPTMAGTPHTRAPGNGEAVSIAKRRLASGEITKEQYDELTRILG